MISLRLVVNVEKGPMLRSTSHDFHVSDRIIELDSFSEPGHVILLGKTNPFVERHVRTAGEIDFIDREIDRIGHGLRGDLERRKTDFTKVREATRRLSRRRVALRNRPYWHRGSDGQEKNVQARSPQIPHHPIRPSSLSTAMPPGASISTRVVSVRRAIVM